MRTDPARTRRSTVRLAVVAMSTLAVLVAGCGSDDDDDAATTTSAEVTDTTEATDTTDTTEATASVFPSEEFCAAQADLEAAQDGAQRNTAIGRMQSALGDDAPAEVADALDTLLEGDLDPTEYVGAEAVLADACG